MDFVTVITEVGFPIAAAIGLGMFVWKLINRIIDGMETKVDVLDEKVAAQVAEMEKRLESKLDAQMGMLVSLLDRVRSVDNEIIRQDTMIIGYRSLTVHWHFRSECNGRSDGIQIQVPIFQWHQSI